MSLAQAQSDCSLTDYLPMSNQLPITTEQPIRMVTPVYPRQAIEVWQEERLSFGIRIGKDGHVKQLELSDDSCIPGYFIKAAREAVIQWVYKPVLLNGKPVEARTTVRVNFVLNEETPPLDVCQVLRTPDTYDGKTLNLKGSLDRDGELRVLKSSACAGEVVIAQSKYWTPDPDAPFRTYKRFAALSGGEVVLRGTFEHHKGPAELNFNRLFLEQVLKPAARPNLKD